MIHFIICRTIVITYKKIQMLFFQSNKGYYIAEGVLTMYKNKYIHLFLLVSFGYSWLIWGSLYWWTDLPIMAIVISGAFGPSIAGFVTMYRLRGGEGVTHLFRKSVQFQMSWKTYVIPLLLVPFLFLVRIGGRIEAMPYSFANRGGSSHTFSICYFSVGRCRKSMDGAAICSTPCNQDSHRF